VASGAGRVINISSITFFTAIPDGLGAYITSKAAVIGYTRALARELGPHGVCVNAIAPGAIPTRAENVIEDRAAYDQQVVDAQCLKRRGTVDEIAATAMFLASDGAGFITGQTLLVDGGWSFN
jgi:3-oxoacyl-[acyl-carrier protein] reductase